LLSRMVIICGQSRKIRGDFIKISNIFLLLTNPKRGLVTGGAGFIGSNFVRYILDRDPGCRVINLDVLTYAGHPENLLDLPDPDRHIFIKGDIREQLLVEKLLKEYSVDTIIHFAAESHVDRSILGPAQFIQTNILGTFSLLEATRKVWLQEGKPSTTVRFHHVSTDEVFGTLRPDDPAFNENTRYAPNSPYSASKASSDHLVRAYYYTYGLPVTISNCSNNYGPYQFPEKLIPLIIMNTLQGKPLPIYGDGRQIRDWLYVEDHCEAIYEILKNGRVGETYNIGGNNQPTNLEIVTQICEIMDDIFPDSPNTPHKGLMRFVKDRPGHDRRYAMDITRIQKELNWNPNETLKSGLRKTINWYLSHMGWLESILQDEEFKDWIRANYSDQRGRVL